MAGVALVLLARVAAGFEPENLQGGLPTDLEDAFPTEYRSRQLLTSVRYERTADRKDALTVLPTLQWGFAPDWEADVIVPFIFGSADKTGSRDIGVEVLRTLHEGSFRVPAVAVLGELDFPSGRKSAGVDTRLAVIATQKLTALPTQHRIHLNLDWMHDAGRMAGARGDRYAVIAGYSRHLGPETLLVADVLREQARERDQTMNVIEIGLRRTIGQDVVVTGAAGPGFAEESPRIRVTVGFEYSF